MLTFVVDDLLLLMESNNNQSGLYQQQSHAHMRDDRNAGYYWSICAIDDGLHDGDATTQWFKHQLIWVKH